MVPLAFVLVRRSRLINAVVPSDASGIPVNTAVGPRQVNVDFALVARVHAFANRIVFRLEFRRPAGPKFNRHRIFNGIDRVHCHFDAVISIEVHIASGRSGLPGFLRSCFPRPIAFPSGRIIQLHQHLDNEVTGPVPLQRSIQYKTPRHRRIRHLARCGQRTGVKTIQ